MSNEEKITELEQRIAKIESNSYSERAKVQELVFVKTATTPVTENKLIGDEGTFTFCKTPEIYVVAEFQGKLYKLYAEPYDGNV